jgi:hypothetical protein
MKRATANASSRLLSVEIRDDEVEISGPQEGENWVAKRSFCRQDVAAL